MNFFSSQPTPYDLKFRLFGFPIRITPWFWVTSALLGANLGGAKEIVLWIAAVLLGILVHELGHAFAMRYYGFQPEITFHAMGGLTSYNDYQFNRRFLSNRDHIIIDAAGPLAGFALLGVISAILLFIGVNPISFMFGAIDEQQRGSLFRFLSGPVIVFFLMEMRICLFWGILNLMPVYPLDGGLITREICIAYNPAEGNKLSYKISFFASLVLVAIALLWLDDFYMAAFFGLFAYSSWQAMNNPW